MILDALTARIYRRRHLSLSTQAVRCAEVTRPVRSVSERADDKTFLGLASPHVIDKRVRVKLSGVLPTALNAQSLGLKLHMLNRTWSGAVCAEEMRSAQDPNWWQTEWAGWYFERFALDYLADELLLFRDVLTTGEAIFDAYNVHPWDLKVHALKMTSGKANPRIILNDRDAMQQALQVYGKIGLLVVEGVADTRGTAYRTWRDNEESTNPAKCKKVADQQVRKNRRALKDSFTPTAVKILVITREDAELLWQTGVLKIHQQGRQTSGARRAVKMSLDMMRVIAQAEVVFNV